MSDWTPRVCGKGPVLVATWSEDFNCFYRFETLEYARGFCDGYGSGAGQYGAGKCSSFVLQGESLVELKEECPKDWTEVKEMLRRTGLSGEVEGAQ